MKKHMKQRLINIFIGCLLSVCCKAQMEGYKFYAALDSVKTSGFYNISLSPEINAHLKIDYRDVRIVNGAGKWVPHAVHVPAFEINTDIVNADLKYSIKENNKTNTIIIINAANLSLNDIQLSIRNTIAERYCSLSGSEDNANWFVVNDSIFINPTPTETKNDNVFSLNFPLSNYKFYKLVIINSNKDPLSINGIASSILAYEPHITKREVIKNSIPTISQKDSGKISYIKIIQQHPYHFDGFNIKISGVKYYSRNADIFIPTNANHSFSNPGKLLQSYTISNNSNLSFRLPLINDSLFYLLIHNEDNLPLRVNEVNTTLNEPILKTYLEVGDNYRLIMGNEKAVQPIYDITKLNISLRDTAPSLTIKNISAFPQQEIKVVKEGNKKWMIWAALIAGLALLLLLTKKMIKEVDKKKPNDNI
jgi:hypothetical protein